MIFYFRFLKSFVSWSVDHIFSSFYEDCCSFLVSRTDLNLQGMLWATHWWTVLLSTVYQSWAGAIFLALWIRWQRFKIMINDLFCFHKTICFVFTKRWLLVNQVCQRPVAFVVWSECASIFDSQTMYITRQRRWIVDWELALSSKTHENVNVIDIPNVWWSYRNVTWSKISKDIVRMSRHKLIVCHIRKNVVFESLRQKYSPPHATL